MLPPEFYELLRFWFSNQDFWFNATPEQDRIITEKFYKLLNRNVEIDDGKYCEPVEYLAFIIVYDQLVRHFYRGCGVSSVYHNIAIGLAKEILDDKLDEKLLPEERIFVLLPFRHGTTKDKEYALEKIKEYRRHDPLNSYYRRFFQANVRSLVKINDSKLEFYNEYVKDFPSSLICDTSVYRQRWRNSIFYRFFSTDTKPPTPEPRNSKLLEKFMTPFKNLPKKITISLSGGVDSMLCSWILKYLNFEVTAVMIDYNNRETCENEVKFVNWWCSYLKIPLVVRKITEINRSRDTDREFYESITKDIRFNVYKFVGNPVVLGHNRDDCLENVFSNIKKLRSLDNLLGMEFHSVQKDVQIYRPILSFEKKEILELANDLEIPYLYDSTPKWCQRGKFRDQLIPFLKEFDPEILDKLIEFSEHTREQNTIFNDMVDNSYDVYYPENNKVIDYTYNGFTYWKRVFEKERIVVSNKSIKNLVDRIGKRSFGKIHLGKNLIGELKYGTLILFI